ncbi:MAG: hypothetical protein ABIK92_21865 [Pseudomonadota bacterium]
MDINKVATIAANTNTTRERAMDVIKELAERIDDSNLDLLASLYSYFLPKSPKVSKKNMCDDFAWVCMASEQHDSQFRYILCKDGWMYATDGKRAHKASTEKENGLYTVAGDKVSDNVDLSCFVRIFDAQSWAENAVASRLHVAMMEKDIFTYVDKKTKKECQIPTYKYNGIAYNRKYVNQAMGDFTVSAIAEKDKPLYLQYGNSRFALVMPIKVFN